MSDVLGKTLPYDTFEELRDRIAKDWPHLALPGLSAPSWSPLGISGAGAIGADPLRYPIGDYYLTNPVARASEVMQECAEVILRDEHRVLEAAE